MPGSIAFALADITLGRLVLAQRPHGQAAAVERIGVLWIELDRRVVIGKREIVLVRALVDIAAIDERLGEVAVEPDRLVEVLQRTPGLADRPVG